MCHIFQRTHRCATTIFYFPSTWLSIKTEHLYFLCKIMFRLQPVLSFRFNISHHKCTYKTQILLSFLKYMLGELWMKKITKVTSFWEEKQNKTKTLHISLRTVRPRRVTSSEIPHRQRSKIDCLRKLQSQQFHLCLSNVSWVWMWTFPHLQKIRQLHALGTNIILSLLLWKEMCFFYDDHVLSGKKGLFPLKNKYTQVSQIKAFVHFPVCLHSHWCLKEK